MVVFSVLKLTVFLYEWAFNSLIIVEEKKLIYTFRVKALRRDWVDEFLNTPLKNEQSVYYILFYI